MVIHNFVLPITIPCPIDNSQGKNLWYTAFNNWKFTVGMKYLMESNLTKGKPLWIILRFALPMLVGGIIQQLYSMLDMLVVGNAIGSRSLAAIGAADAPAFFARAIIVGLTTGFTAVAARHFGANNLPLLRKVLAGTLYISLVAAIVLALGGIFGAGPVMTLLQTPEDIKADAVLYLQITIGAGIGMVFYNAAAALLRAVGDSKTPVIFLTVAFLINIPLTILLVVFFEMGVAGAGIASIIAQTMSAIACWVFMFKRFEIFRLTRDDIAPHFKTIGHILRIGLPVGVQTLLLAGGDMTIMGVVNTFGTDVVAAYTTGSRIMMMAMMLCMHIALAHAVFAGQNLGAGEIDRIRQGFKETAWIMISLSVVIAVVVFVFGDNLVGLFIAETDMYIQTIMPIARQFLRIGTVFYVFLGMIWLYNYTLSGMGDVVVPFVSSLCELIAKVGGTLLLSLMFGYVGVWFAMPIGWILGVIPSSIRFHTGGWKSKASIIR